MRKKTFGLACPSLPFPNIRADTKHRLPVKLVSLNSPSSLSSTVAQRCFVGGESPLSDVSVVAVEGGVCRSMKIDPFNFAPALTLRSGFLYDEYPNLCGREK